MLFYQNLPKINQPASQARRRKDHQSTIIKELSNNQDRGSTPNESRTVHPDFVRQLQRLQWLLVSAQLLSQLTCEIKQQVQLSKNIL